MFESAQGIVVRLNQDDEIVLSPCSPVELANLSGVKVRLESDGTMVSCEARLRTYAGESPDPMRWCLRVQDQTSPPWSDVGTLEQLISSAQVALNGRL